MMHFFSLLTGFIPKAYANTPALTNWGTQGPNANDAVSDMWTMIGNSVYTNIPAQDLVHALTGGIVHLIFTFIAGASSLLIMYAGIRMIVARGKDDEFTQGKTIITWALIGLVLSLLANVVVTFFETGFLPEFLN